MKKITLTEFGMGFLTMANMYFKSMEKSGDRILSIDLWNPAYLSPENLRWLQRLGKHTNSRHIFPCMRNLSNQGNLHLLLHFASQWVPWKAQRSQSWGDQMDNHGDVKVSIMPGGSGGCPRKNQSSQNLPITFKYVPSSGRGKETCKQTHCICCIHSVSWNKYKEHDRCWDNTFF